MYEIFASREQENLYTTLDNKGNGVEHLSWKYDLFIKKALLIKKHNPQLNRQLYANGSSFLLNVY